MGGDGGTGGADIDVAEMRLGHRSGARGVGETRIMGISGVPDLAPAGSTSSAMCAS
jgi:hypothetical protein